MNANKQKISFKEKLGYGLGDTASNLFFQTFLIFLLFFYTDVFGISAAIAGTMFLITRIWDTINDPLMGIIADRTKTRWGKFRPYILWLAIPFGLIGFLMFYTPDFEMAGKIIYAYITYSFMMMIYTAINIPYSALMGVISSDSLQRTSLSSFRFVCAFAGALIVQSFTIPLIENFGQDKNPIVQAEVVDHTIKFNEVNAGTTKIILVATDSEGNEEETDFHVKVRSKESNLPVLVNPVSDLTLEEGFTEKKMDIRNVFRLRDPDKVVFKVNSSNEEVVKVRLDNHQLIIKEEGIGFAKITFSGQDKRWGNTDNIFRIFVLEKGNSKPVLKDTLKNIHLKTGFKSVEIDLNKYITDTLNDNLTFLAQSSNSSIAFAKVNGSILQILERGKGIASVNITADDNKGGVTETSFSVQITDESDNPPYLTRKVNSINLNTDFGSYNFDISNVFIEPDNGELNYSVKVINEIVGFRNTIILFAILSALMFLITFYTTKERVQPSVKQKTSLIKDLGDLVNNKPWIVLFFAGIFTLSWVSIHLGTTVYYFKYYVGDETKVSLFLVVGSIFNILGVISTKYISSIFGKKKLYFICMLGQSILLGLFYLAGPNDFWLMYSLHIFSSYLSGPTQPLVWAMYADTADYSEWKTGRRATGLVFSAATFAQKMGWTIGGALTGWILAYYGFMANEVQTPETQEGIRIMKSIYPAIGGILASLTILFYNLDEKLVKKIQTDLEKRRHEEDATK